MQVKAIAVVTNSIHHNVRNHLLGLLGLGGRVIAGGGGTRGVAPTKGGSLLVPGSYDSRSFHNDFSKGKRSTRQMMIMCVKYLWNLSKGILLCRRGWRLGEEWASEKFVATNFGRNPSRFWGCFSKLDADAPASPRASPRASRPSTNATEIQTRTALNRIRKCHQFDTLLRVSFV